MPFVWSIGTIIGPAIGGTFVDPHESFPNAFPEGGVFHRFPYLLPNLICAALLLVSVVMGYFLLEETHPDMCPRVLLTDHTYISNETPLLETSDALKRPALHLPSETYGTFHGAESQDESIVTEKTKAMKTGIFNRRIMALIVSLSIFTYHSMTYDHLLPIFFEDDRASSPVWAAAKAALFYSPGGLGLSVRAVGMIMAVNGLIALFVQAVVFPIAAEKIGVHRLFLLVVVLHPIAYLLVPGLLHVGQNILYPSIYFCLTVRNILSIILYPLLLILIKEATPSAKMLGKVNGFAASAGAACRMVAPPVAGYLYSMGSRIDCTALAWFGSALVAVIGAIQCFAVERQHNESRDEEQSTVLSKPEGARRITAVATEE